MYKSIVYAVLESRHPAIIELCEACLREQRPYPAKVILQHKPGCAIFQDITLPLEACDCNPTLKASGKRPITPASRAYRSNRE